MAPKAYDENDLVPSEQIRNAGDCGLAKAYTTHGYIERDRKGRTALSRKQGELLPHVSSKHRPISARDAFMSALGSQSASERVTDAMRNVRQLHRKGSKAKHLPDSGDIEKLLDKKENPTQNSTPTQFLNSRKATQNGLNPFKRLNMSMKAPNPSAYPPLRDERQAENIPTIHTRTISSAANTCRSQDIPLTSLPSPAPVPVTAPVLSPIRAPLSTHPNRRSNISTTSTEASRLMFHLPPSPPLPSPRLNSNCQPQLPSSLPPPRLQPQGDWNTYIPPLNPHSRPTRQQPVSPPPPNANTHANTNGNPALKRSLPGAYPHRSSPILQPNDFTYIPPQAAAALGSRRTPTATATAMDTSRPGTGVTRSSVYSQPGIGSEVSVFGTRRVGMR